MKRHVRQGLASLVEDLMVSMPRKRDNLLGRLREQMIADDRVGFAQSVNQTVGEINRLLDADRVAQVRTAICNLKDPANERVAQEWLADAMTVMEPVSELEMVSVEMNVVRLAQQLRDDGLLL